MKRKIRLLTFAGLVLGFLIFVLSASRWSYVYNDPSQAFFGMGIGVIIIAFAYIYQRFVELSEDVEDLKRGLDLQNMWIRDELKKRIKWKKTK